MDFTLDGGEKGRVALHDDLTRDIAPTRAPGDLGEELEGARSACPILE